MRPFESMACTQTRDANLDSKEIREAGQSSIVHDAMIRLPGNESSAVEEQST
jgi:hypothetical protein